MCVCVFVCARLGILPKTFDVFCFKVFCDFVIRVRDGFGEGFRVRDRVSVRARGGLDFIHYSPESA